MFWFPGLPASVELTQALTVTAAFVAGMLVAPTRA